MVDIDKISGQGRVEGKGRVWGSEVGGG